MRWEDGHEVRPPPRLSHFSYRIRQLEQADHLDHVASVVGQEGVQVGLRITVVGAPTGNVVDVVVAFVAVASVVTCVVPLSGVNALNQVDDDSAFQSGLDGLLVSVSTVGVLPPPINGL